MELPDSYTIERKKVKHARIRVSESLMVRVVVPESFSSKEVELLLEKKDAWIKDTVSRFRNKQVKIKLHPNQLLLFGNRYTYYHEPHLHYRVLINHEHRTIQSKQNLTQEKEQLRWYRKFAKDHITERLNELAEKHGFTYNKVFIRSQRTKWGNCTAGKNLSFNWKLIKAPAFAIDYVILHELVHTEVMNHSKDFWVRLRSLCGEYREAQDWLERYGNGL